MGLCDAGNGTEQPALLLERRMRVDVPVDQLLCALDPFIEISEMFFDTLAHQVNCETG